MRIMLYFIKYACMLDMWRAFHMFCLYFIYFYGEPFVFVRCLVMRMIFVCILCWKF